VKLARERRRDGRVAPEVLAPVLEQFFTD